jgi:cytochrome o ubiquinol oxidase operon protein cyoD
MNRSVGSVRSYIFGFILSIALTLGAYIPVVLHQSSGRILFSYELLVPLIFSLAVMQLFVQLIFFLHLGHEKGPRWNLIFLVATVSIILLVVLGSIWIMYHLNYRMMPKEMGPYMEKEEMIHYNH